MQQVKAAAGARRQSHEFPFMVWSLRGLIENGEIPVSDQAHLPKTLTDLSQWKVDPAQGDQPLYIVYIFLYSQDAETKIECQ